jgi:hypothetical protein
MAGKILLFCILPISLLVCGCCCLTSGGNSPAVVATVTENPTLIATVTPTSSPRSLPTGTYLLNDMTGGTGDLSIDNSLDVDAVVILCKTSDTKHPLMSVYVKAESTFDAVGIDDGTYYIYDMTGLDWDSSAKKFTRSLNYERFDDSFDFTNYDWDIGLKPRVGGNADYSLVTSDSFPTY